MVVIRDDCPGSRAVQHVITVSPMTGWM